MAPTLSGYDFEWPDNLDEGADVLEEVSEDLEEGEEEWSGDSDEGDTDELADTDVSEDEDLEEEWTPAPELVEDDSEDEELPVPEVEESEEEYIDSPSVLVSDDDWDEEDPDNLSTSPDVVEENYNEGIARAAFEITKGSFSISDAEVHLDELAFSAPLKVSRKDTHRGLAQSVREMGILQPIQVMLTEGYGDWLENPVGSVYTGGYKYIVIDGFRRVFAATRNGLKTSPARVWNFDDKERGTNLVLPLSLLLNKHQNRSTSETWGLLEVLEDQFAMTPNTLEYLLQLDGGDAMRLKDIMTSQFEDVKSELLEGKKNILQAYNALQKARKELDQLAEDDSHGLGDMEEAEGVVSTEDDGRTQLDASTVAELLEMAGTEAALSDDDFGMISGSDQQAEVQDVGDRHSLAPELRQAALRKDNYRCVICGIGGPAFLSTLVVHHAIPVHCKGSDALDNLVTLCDSDHLNVHYISNHDCMLPMTRAEYDEYSEEEKKRIKLSVQFARLIDKARKETNWKGRKESIGHRMPGVGVGEVVAGFNQDGRPQVASEADVPESEDAPEDDVETGSDVSDYDED